ncbi:MAG: DnaT-like ssDNA-binding domain-containing protein [Gammaproteobacteria bacterium]
MASKLVPERPLVFSPTLAATIGLEEAIFLQVLMDFAAHRPTRLQDHYHWVAITDGDLETALPFWPIGEIKRIEASLRNLGMILRKAEAGSSDRFLYALYEKAEPETEPVASAPTVDTAPHPVVAQATEPPQRPVDPAQIFRRGAGGSPIPLDWMPGEEWLIQCRQHNIPDQFSLGLVPEFVSYWRERGQAQFSWGNKFFKHVLRSWREEQSRQGAHELASTMHRDWEPSQDALEILVHAGIPEDFIEDAIPEFVLYWRERGIRISTWNSKFIEHIRRQWDKYNASFGHDDTPRPIPLDWQPSPACFEILQLAEIDLDYARTKLPEFVLYWRDSQQARASWNTVFLQFIKQDWARRLNAPLEVESAHGNHQIPAREGQHSVEEKLRQLTDRSWAENARHW